MNSAPSSSRRGANRPISAIVTPDGWVIINAKERVAPPGAAAGPCENLFAVRDPGMLPAHLAAKPAGRSPIPCDRKGRRSRSNPRGVEGFPLYLFLR